MVNEALEVSRTVRKATFHCLNDCQQTGCPGHRMELILHHTSDTVTLAIDGKYELTMDDNKFYTMVALARGEISQ